MTRIVVNGERPDPAPKSNLDARCTFTVITNLKGATVEQGSSQPAPPRVKLRAYLHPYPVRAVAKAAELLARRASVRTAR
jgi:hypothetical protein